MGIIHFNPTVEIKEVDDLQEREQKGGDTPDDRPVGKTYFQEGGGEGGPENSITKKDNQNSQSKKRELQEGQFGKGCREAKMVKD